MKRRLRKNSRAPVPVFKICSTTEAQISMWKGLEAAAVRVSLDHKSRCSPAKNAKHLPRVAWICGVFTIPSDVICAMKTLRGPAVVSWTWGYSSGQRRRKSCRVFDGGSSLYIGPFPPNQSQSKTSSHRWFPLSKIAKSNSTQKTKCVDSFGFGTLAVFYCEDPFSEHIKQNQ